MAPIIKNKQRIDMSLQQLNVVVAFLLMSAFFIFLAGVLLGRKSSAAFLEQLTMPTFADTLCTAFIGTGFLISGEHTQAQDLAKGIKLIEEQPFIAAWQRSCAP